MVKDLHGAILLNLILVVLQYAVFILQTAYTSLVELIAFFFCLDVNSGIPLMHHRWPSSGFTFFLSFTHTPSSLVTLAILHFLSGRGQMIPDSK